MILSHKKLFLYEQFKGIDEEHPTCVRYLEKSQWQIKYQQAQQQVSELQTKLESQGARFEQEKIASDEKLRLLEVAEERLKEQFENVANKIYRVNRVIISRENGTNARVFTLYSTQNKANTGCP